MKPAILRSERLLPVTLIFLSLLATQTAHAWYDPGLQRWINTDPLGEEGSEVARLKNEPLLPSAFGPGQLMSGPNLYAFVGGAPLTRTDAVGLLSPGCKAFQLAMGAALVEQ